MVKRERRGRNYTDLHGKKKIKLVVSVLISGKFFMLFCRQTLGEKAIEKRDGRDCTDLQGKKKIKLLVSVLIRGYLFLPRSINVSSRLQASASEIDEQTQSQAGRLEVVEDLGAFLA